MFERKTRVLTILAYLSILHPLFAFNIDFSSSANYKSGVLQGWSLQNSTAAYPVWMPNEPIAPDELSSTDDKGLKIKFYSATQPNLLKCSSKIEDALVCNTISAKLRIYVQSGTEKFDAFQVVVATNANFKEYKTIGEPAYIREFDRTASEWVTFTSSVAIADLTTTQPDLYVGVLMIPAGKSHNYGFIKSLEVSIVAAATPKNACIKRNETVVQKDDLVPGDGNLLMSVDVDPDPNDDRLQLEGVYGVVNRNGEYTTNRLARVAGTHTYTNVVVSSAVDAGESLNFSAFSRYKCSIPAAGEYNPDDEYLYESTGDLGTYVVGKSGSVWINEFSASRVEICGTTNRVMSSGWVLAVADADGNRVCWADLGSAFDFSTNMINGVVGLDVRELKWNGTFPTDLATYTVSLCNSQGVSEHAVEMVFASGAIGGLTGCAKWPDLGYAYDWTGTASDGTFTWGVMTESSFGRVNPGQGFNVPATVSLTVDTVISYATVVLSITNFNNSTTWGAITNITETSVDGIATFEVSGYTPFTNDIHAAVSGVAFGWHCSGKGVVLTNGCDHLAAIRFDPTVATDDFSEKADSWDWEGQTGNLCWDLESVTRSGAAEKVLSINTFAKTDGRGVLKCRNYLSAHGRKLCAVAFDYRNVVNSYPRDDFSVLISTNSDPTVGVSVSSPKLSNKRLEYGDLEWYRYQTAFALPEGFSEAPELWIQLICDSQYQTHTHTMVDNLSIAFQDVAMPTNLARSVETIANNQSCDFRLDLEAQTLDCVTNVSAELCLISQFTGESVVTTNWVPFAFADKSFTNAIYATDSQPAMAITAAELTEALGHPFMTGEQVTYYAAVRYYANNGDLNQTTCYECRYLPDDHALTNADGIAYWVYETPEGGSYGVSTNLFADPKYNFSVSGPALSVVGDPVATASSVQFLVHAFASDIASITVTAMGKSYSLYSGDPTNRVTMVFDSAAFGVTGLVSGETYTFTVTGLDKNGNPLTSGGAPVEITFTTLPPTPTVTISGVYAAGGAPTTAVKLSAQGTASGFVVQPDAWVRDADVWTQDAQLWNREYTATVYATNLVGGASAKVVTNGYSLAAAPTKAPVLTLGETSVTVRAKDYDPVGDDANPENTEYALRITTSNGGDAAVTNLDGIIWKPLGDWRTNAALVVASPLIDLTATNYFSFIARNFAGEVSTNSVPVTTNCWFDMSVIFKSAAQLPVPATERTTRKTFAFDLQFFDPAQSDSAQRGTASASVEYKIGSGAWTALCESFTVPFSGLVASTNLDWDAWLAVGRQDGEYAYQIRATITSSGRVAQSVCSGTLDFAPPSGLNVTGTPADGSTTSDQTVSLSASVSDAAKSDVAYHWNFNGVSSEGATLTGSAKEGANAASVYATDAMSNACEAVGRKWTLDTQRPSKPTLSGYPADNTITNRPGYRYIATAVDDTTVTYHWSIDGETWTALASEVPFEGSVAVEQAYTVRVYATDAALNVSETNSWTWTYDCTPTAKPVISGYPADGIITNRPGYRYTATAAGAAKYHWSIDGETWTALAPEVPFEGSVAAEQAYTVRVYTTDAALNVSETNSWTWTYDCTPTAKPVISGYPTDKAVTNQPGYRYTAAAEGAAKCHWSIDGETWTALAPSAAFEGSVTAEQAYTVRVYTTDAALNVSETNSWTWTYDHTPPTKPTITGTPANGSTTSDKTVSLAAESTDKTTITYHWTFNDVKSVGATLVGTAREGANTASVYATDAANNVSATNYWSWTVDTIPPQLPAITGTPVKDSFTNSKDYNFSASAVDATDQLYYWSLSSNGVMIVSDKQTNPFTGSVVGDGVYTASVYSVDAALNVSPTNYWFWTVDTVRPTVVLATELSMSADFQVLASFSKRIKSFTAGSVSVTHGTVTGVTGPDASGTNYTFTVKADNSELDPEVWIAEGAVQDLAGNAVVESDKLTLTKLTVCLSSATPNPFGSTNVFTVVASFSAGIQAFPASAVTVGNGEVTSGPTVDENSYNAEVEAYTNYTFVVTPDHDGEVSVQILKGAVKDLSGNGNKASDPLTDANGEVYVCDVTPPAVSVTFGPSSGSFFGVYVEFSEPVTGFTDDLISYSNASNPEGMEVIPGIKYLVAFAGYSELSRVWMDANRVRDLLGNPNVASSVMCVGDVTPPTQPVISGCPANGSTTNGAPFSLTAKASDENGIDRYVWTWTAGGESTVITNIVGSLADGKLTGEAKSGVNTVTVCAYDSRGNQSAVSGSWSWTYDASTPVAPDVKFGDEVWLPVVEGETNEVTFTAMSYQSGTGWSFTMSGFEADQSSIANLALWFITESQLGGVESRVAVEKTAEYDSEKQELTVHLPAAATAGKSTFFILGVDNKAE